MVSQKNDMHILQGRRLILATLQFKNCTVACKF